MRGEAGRGQSESLAAGIPSHEIIQLTAAATKAKSRIHWPCFRSLIPILGSSGVRVSE